MTESCSVEITFDAKQQKTELKIIASLDATDELSEAAEKIVVRNIQVAAGPRSTEIRSNIKSLPVVGRRGYGSR